MVRWVFGSILHGVEQLSYFSFQPVLHDWCNKCRGMYYPVCWMMHIKEPLHLIGKSSLCGGSGFPLSLSEWSFTICVTPYNRKLKNVLSASLNKTFPSFLPSIAVLSSLSFSKCFPWKCPFKFENRWKSHGGQVWWTGWVRQFLQGTVSQSRQCNQCLVSGYISRGNRGVVETHNIFS